MHHDIVIVGAGPTGLAFSRLLADTGLRIALIDRQSAAELADPPVDGRDIALTHQSQRILREIGAWERMPADAVSELRAARVLDGDSDRPLGFDGDPGQVGPLGWLVANHLIRQALYRTVAPLDGIELITGVSVEEVSSNDAFGRVRLSDGRELTAGLVIGADNRFSATRRQMGIAAEIHDFGRVAIVCRMRHERPHDNVAWECFHYGRTLAILPMPGDAVSVVITVKAREAQAVLDLGVEAFNADIERRFGNRLGRMRLEGERFSYPLVGVHAKRFVGQRFALIGDAAVGMHPVTAQGFNLALSGAELLATQVRRALRKGLDIADRRLLAAYQAQHMLDTRPLYHGTNLVVGLFTDDRLPATLLRKAVVELSARVPPVQWAIRHKLMARDGLFRPPLPPVLPALPGLAGLLQRRAGA